MIKRVKRRIANRISNILRGLVREEMERVLPIIPQLSDFETSSKEDRQSFYDHTKNPLESIGYYEGLRDRLEAAGVIVDSVAVDIRDFERWLSDFPEIKKHYGDMGDVSIQKCMEHYLTFKYLNISPGDVYIDIGSSESPWAGILNRRGTGRGTGPKRENAVKAYKLDISFPKGINRIKIGADAGATRLPDNFASVLSLQCAYECFMGNADVKFLEEAGRILNQNGRYGIVPLYLADIHFVSTSPYCNQSEILIEPEAKKVWRDDEYHVPFSRHYSPESFASRIYSRIPNDMEGKVFYFNNLAETMKYYTGQRVYCFFMFFCEKKQK